MLAQEMLWLCLGLMEGWVMQLTGEDLLLPMKSSLSFLLPDDLLPCLIVHYMTDTRKTQIFKLKIALTGNG